MREAFPYMAATITPIAAETRNFISRRPNLESGNYTRGSREKEMVVAYARETPAQTMKTGTRLKSRRRRRSAE